MDEPEPRYMMGLGDCVVINRNEELEAKLNMADILFVVAPMELPFTTLGIDRFIGIARFKGSIYVQFLISDGAEYEYTDDHEICWICGAEQTCVLVHCLKQYIHIHENVFDHKPVCMGCLVPLYLWVKDECKTVESKVPKIVSKTV